MGDVLKIDWLNHDGVNLSMINDYMRNQFYDRILSDTVKDRNCIDIGFGTGLLSILALKHGAKHVLAFEKDNDRFCLGKTIIERLGLQDKIHLLNESYDHEYNTSDRLIFSETVNGNLWQEGLWRSLPRQKGTLFLPGVYWLEIRMSLVPNSWASKLGILAPETRYFDPGVDVDPLFVSTINSLISQNLGIDIFDLITKPLVSGINIFEHEINTIWGWVPYLRTAEYASSALVRYELDAIESTLKIGDDHHDIDWDQSCISMTVPIDCSDTRLLVPRTGMKHHGHTLTLDTGHWGPCQKPMILHNYKGMLVINHDLKSGKIDYKLE